MCGKTVVPNSRTYDEIGHRFSVRRAAIDLEWVDRTAIPGEQVHVLFDWKGDTCLVDMHWGFRGTELYNARSDALSRATWRQSYTNNRCVFPVSAFIEKTRTFTDPDGSELYIAGIYGVTPKTKLFCVSLITAPANSDVAVAHSRMPLLMPAEGVLDWISPKYHGKAAPLLGEFTEYTKDTRLASVPAGSE